MGTPKLALPFKGLFNGRLFFTAAILALSQFNFSFEGSAFTNIQAMEHFTHQFGKTQPDGSVVLEPQWLSFFNGFSIVGFACGVIIGNRLTDRFGRRFTVRVMCIWTIICTTVLLTARTSDQMLAGRALNYLYIGMELAVIPLYQAEITPLQARGAMVASYNTALLTGMLVMSLVCYGTSEIPSKTSYLLPIGLFYCIPAIVLACTFWMPESPRWLVLRERHEEALDALRLFRGGKFSEEQIQEELASIQAACGSQHYKPTEASFAKRWLQIWSRKHIKRTGIVLATNFFLHGTGNAFAGMYGTLFFRSIGTVNPFVLSVVNSIVALVVSIMTLFLVDMIGRRPLLLGGSSIQASALLIMGGLGMISNPSVTVKGGIIATMMIFGAGYCASWGQLSHTITAELPSAEVRDLTYATGSLLAISTQAAMTFGLPYLLNPPYAALGPRVGFIFGSLAAVSVGFAFFCMPECHGKSLEEIDTLFNNKVPIRKLKKTHVNLLEQSKVGEATVDHKEFKVAEEAV
ncbi:MFS domain-containing protein [Fusarium keratoplasticum]|uniref:MFS domain-containing protein n=1 Tax=Fusarium keratoplasticum TaxID=1328300 RepID=A0ACC0R9S7_9HYPO|nr:MFS domain-containing protein [Fusarium keratoplasticum]KAI8664609.1 MFS domain-containing protein [Fusarium keratoplasticum]KAI8675991.1 MFS domain-containing protein [Fusarium keratoplasticum]